MQVWRNGGAPASTAATIADVERYGVTWLLDELESDLRERHLSAAPGPAGVDTQAGASGKEAAVDPRGPRPVVQAALKTVLEPVFEADMMPCSFGFRPKTVGPRRPAGLAR